MANDVADLDAEQLMEEWSTSSNEAITLSLYQGDKRIEYFNPQFTYPIYGNEEVIFGYQDLEVELAFAAHNLTPHLSFKYKEKFPARGEIQAGEVVEPLQDFLPASAFESRSRSQALAAADAATFVPPGKKIHTFESKGSAYEIWCSPLSEPSTKQILQNMQILVPMFIEGGTILELEYDWIVNRWKVFLMYRVDPAPPAGTSGYIFAGYATSFQVFTLPSRDESPGSEAEHITIEQWDVNMEKLSSTVDISSQSDSPLSLPSRERISQFIILPSQQKHGLGSRLYSAVYQYLIAPSNILELTVEDPNEEFDDMRDITDLVNLRTGNETFRSLSLPSNIANTDLANTVPTSIFVSKETRSKLSKESKIQPRQLNRLIEMQLLSKIPAGHRSRNRITRKDKSSNEHDRQYYFWRLLVKERLFSQNRDTLIQLEPEERHEKVDETVDSVQMDYDRLIGRADDRIKRLTGAGQNGVKKRVRKRSAGAEDGAEGVVVKDGVEVEEEADEAAGGARKKRKRAIVEDDEDGEDL